MNGNLAITRKAGESFVIEVGDETIEVQVVRIGPNSARLRVNAPKHMNIRRSELAPIEIGVLGSHIGDPEALSKAALAVKAEQREQDN